MELSFLLWGWGRVNGNLSSLIYDQFLWVVLFSFTKRICKTNTNSELLFGSKYTKGNFVSSDSVWNEIDMYLGILHLLYFLIGFIFHFKFAVPLPMLNNRFQKYAYHWGKKYMWRCDLRLQYYFQMLITKFSMALFLKENQRDILA